MGHRANKPAASPSLSLSERATAARLGAARHMPTATEPAQFSNARAYADSFDFSLFSTPIWPTYTSSRVTPRDTGCGSPTCHGARAGRG
jgi:hypothetical protein